MHDSNLSSLDFSDPCFLGVSSVAQNQLILTRLAHAVVSASRGLSCWCPVQGQQRFVAPPRANSARKRRESKPTALRCKLSNDGMICPTPSILTAKNGAKSSRQATLGDRAP